MTRLFKKIMGIHEEEREKTLLMFAYIFLIIATLLILKPTRNSLFLTKIGISRLPYAFILVAATAILVTKFLTRLSRTIRLNRRILVQLSLSALVFMAFWLVFQSGWTADFIIYAFYAWVALFGLIAASDFWLLASYVFNAREAKRIFGFIGAGSISGGIFGGYLTRLLAPVIGTNNLLLISVGFILTCIILLQRIWSKHAQTTYSARLAREKKIGQAVPTTNSLSLFKNSRHLAYLAGIIGIGVVVANLLDYQYNAIVSNAVRDPDRLTAFFGFWLSNLSIASLIIQLFFTSHFIKKAGVIASLFLLPIGISAGTIAVLIQPALWSAVILKVADGGLKQSVNRSGMELLALPLPGHIKSQGKTVVDVLVDSLATGFSGILLILITNQLGLGIREISFAILAAIVIWIVFIIRVRPEYINAFRQALIKRTIDLSDQTVNVRDASVFHTLLQVLEGKNERQVLYALQLLENVRDDKFIPVLKRLIQHPFHEVRLQALQFLIRYENPDIIQSIQSLIEDDDENIRIAAVRHACKNAEDRAEKLMTYLNHMKPAVRSAALICAAAESRENVQFREQMDIEHLFNDFVDTYLQEEDDVIQKKFVQLTLARVIGIADDPRLYPFLQVMLKDDDLDVVEHAVRSAGAIRDPVFIPDLIGLLDSKNIRQTVREALAQYGDDVLDALNQALENPGEERHIQYAIPRVLARIESQTSVKYLFDYLEKKDIRMHYSCVAALNKLRVRFPLLPFDKKDVFKHLSIEIERYRKTISILNTFKTLRSTKTTDASKQAQNGREQAYDLLMQALKERLMENVETIFILLGLIHPQKDMNNAYRAITGQNPLNKANALELLDNVLAPALKPDIIWIAENTGFIESVSVGREVESKLDTEEEAVELSLNKDDYWIKSCTLHLVAESGLTEPKELIHQLTEHHDSVVRETAEYVIERIKEYA